jgi:hypothetical protein
MEIGLYWMKSRPRNVGSKRDCGKGGERKKNRSEEWEIGLNRWAVGDSVI